MDLWVLLCDIYIICIQYMLLLEIIYAIFISVLHRLTEKMIQSLVLSEDFYSPFRAVLEEMMIDQWMVSPTG